MPRQCRCTGEPGVYCATCAAYVPIAQKKEKSAVQVPITAMPEEVFQSKVIGLAKQHGWLLYHTHDSRKSPAGFPDLVLTDGQSLIFAELKKEKEKPSVEQERWLNMLSHTHRCEAYLWRPSDMETIRRRLTRPQGVII